MEYGRKAALFESFAGVAKALANGKRLELLDHLAQGERPVDALAASAGLQVTTASAHLQALHRAGLVGRRREGTRVYYALAGDDVAALMTTLQDVAARRVAGVELSRRAFLTGDRDEVPVVDIGIDELRRRAAADELVVLDVRPHAEFAAGHLPEARSIPVTELLDRLEEVPAGVPVVAYCRGANCVLSHDAVRLLRDRGRDATVVARGVLEWRAAGERLDAA